MSRIADKTSTMVQTRRQKQESCTEEIERIPFEPNSSYADDMNVLYSMWFAKIDTSGTHQNKLESFYGHQAVLYDKFRHRMLHGRNPMLMKMHAPKNGIWVDLGAGTASNLEYFKKNITTHFKKVCVVDLCPSLIDVAKKRVEENKWHNVDVLLGDATDFELKGILS